MRVRVFVSYGIHSIRTSIRGFSIETCLIYTLTAAVTLLLALPVIEVVTHGIPKISLEFITGMPSDSGRQGGIASILVSTFLIVVVSLLSALPLALSTAVVLTEYLPRESYISSFIRGSLDILAGVPSIVFGLFGLAFFCRTLGMGYSILAGGLTLSCMILPTLSRAICNALESVGDQYRVSGAALSLSKATILCRITVPLVLPGITAGVVLGITRAIAETAVLLFTSGYSDRMPTSLTDSGRSISVHIYELATNVPGGQQAAYGSALVLLIALVLLSLFLSFVTSRLQGRLLNV